MRRKEREVTDPQKIREIIAACHCCRLGFCEKGKAYIVPMNFGWEERDGRYVFYFHSAAEGRKIDLIERTHYAAFEMDANTELYGGESACSWSARFQSVMGGGPVRFVEEPEEKVHALRAIMRCNTGRDDWKFEEPALQAVCVFALEAEELSCKEHP